ncbi:MAG: carbohydrate binding domain-containing protein [Bacillus subtilis]|nr:carbohydrate binding domain-containing protein [Bacillus subtilis]
MVPNWNFDTPVAQLTENRISDNWGWHANTGQMTGAIQNGTAVIQIIQIGSVEYGIQFYLLNRTVEQGRTYRISF